MGLRARLLRVVTETGPRSINVLMGLAKTPREQLRFPTIFQDLRAKEMIVMYGNTKGAKWGAPGWRPLKPATRRR